MKSLKLTGFLLLVLAIFAIFAMSTGAWAKKGGKPGGGGTDTGHISMEATGASTQDFVVDAFQDCQEQLAADDTSYLCNKGGVEHDIMLGDFLMGRVYPNGSSAGNCFGSGHYSVTIGVNLNKNSSAETILRFRAFKNDGVTDILYVLRVNDPRGWSGAFPPAVDETTTMGELDGQTTISWTLGASNKNQARNACVDSGSFDVNGPDFIKVDFTRID